jgi:hypothetical protein
MGRSLFVLSCRYADRCYPDDYAALSDDPDWELKHLPNHEGRAMSVPQPGGD